MVLLDFERLFPAFFRLLMLLTSEFFFFAMLTPRKINEIQSHVIQLANTAPQVRL
jgi:hypothetical protein